MNGPLLNPQMAEILASSTSIYEENIESSFMQDRLVMEGQPILFVGEGNTRSLPYAVAAIRGSLDNIWATSLELTSPPTEFAQVILDSQQRSLDNCLKMNTDVSILVPLSAYERLKRAPPSFETLLNLHLQADATDLRSFFQSIVTSPTRNIWFQCPWLAGRGDIPLLIRSFIASASQVQQPGDVLYIGLAMSHTFAQRYDVHGMFQFAAGSGYEHYGEDDEFIQRCLQFGYKHEGFEEVHEKLMGVHETCIFVRQ